MFLRKWIKEIRSHATRDAELVETSSAVDIYIYIYIWKMALVFTFTWFESYERKEHSCGSPIFWLTWKTDLHRQFLEMHGTHVTSRQLVEKWRRTFASGRHNVTDVNRSGKRSASMTEDNTARVEEFTQTDRRVTLLRMASDLSLFYGTVQHFIVDVLQTMTSVTDGCLVP
jgi:hypothetical protein